MATAKLRRVGGSVMLAIPPGLLEALHLGAETVMSLSAHEGALVAKPLKPRYTLESLLAECDPAVPHSFEDRDWIQADSVGRELP